MLQISKGLYTSTSSRYYKSILRLNKKLSIFVCCMPFIDKDNWYYNVYLIESSKRYMQNI